MLRTRLTELFEIEHPVISAPMAFAAGGRLASAVSEAGGLGLIGGAYGDRAWIKQQFQEAGNSKIGCGFITWTLQKILETDPSFLDSILQRQPCALFLSFGDPADLAQSILQSDTKLICQVQTLRDAKRAADIGAHVIVAQGAEAGGHGESRATMTLVPEVADYLANNAPEVILCAAGGIADGRGLAASLMLGAEGVVLGTRLWASEEALVHPNMIKEALSSTGDETIRSSVMDIARKLDWPKRYTARVLKNEFTDKWHEDIEGLLDQANEQAALWKQAWLAGDMKTANTFVGEAAGLIDQVLPAADIVHSIVEHAERCIKTFR